jgi:predicted ferric reductase
MKPSSNSEPDIDQVEPPFSPAWLLVMLLVSAGGAALAILVLPNWLPGMSASIVGEQPKVFWYLSRASGFIAYLLLWASLMLGVGVTNKAASLWPGIPSALELHQYFSFLGVFFTLFHALILMGDAYLKPALTQIITPFSMTNYRPVAVGLGQLGFYLWILILVSFYIRKWIHKKGWRLFHYAGYLMAAFALIHGLLAGTDTSTEWARILYWSTAVLLGLMTVYRMVYAHSRAREKQPIQERPRI